jgi:hypothetical protein
MEFINEEEKRKKFNTVLKTNKVRGYDKARNKAYNNFDDFNNYQTFSYNTKNIANSSPFTFKKGRNETIKQNKKFLKNNLVNIVGFKLKNVNSHKDNDPNGLFYTTSSVMKNKNLLKNKNQFIRNNTSFNANVQDSAKEKNKLINKLFPDINELNKFSNLPFFSMVKMKSPYIVKLDKNEIIKKKFPSEQFLYKISHSNTDEEKINNNNFHKNKGVRKGTTSQFYHGVNKFCINNKISETNFYREDLDNNRLKLELNVDNLSKGEKIPQISNKEKHLKMLENSMKNLKLLPNQLLTDLEDGVFKFIDEEFDKTNNNKSNIDNKDDEDRENKNSSFPALSKDNSEADDKIKTMNNIHNIINLSNQFKYNNTFNKNKFLITAYDYPNSKNKSYYSQFTISGFKKPHQYPINFYSTQQIKKKEHFSQEHKITFEERLKKKKKEYDSEREGKNKKELVLGNVNDLVKKNKMFTNVKAFERDCKIRDIIIGHKLRCEFSPVDIKRVLNGLKPFVDVKLDEENNDIFDKYKESQKIIDNKENKDNENK